MKVLVTGGTGFMGRHLVWRLAREGAEVVFTGRRHEAAQTVCDLSPQPVTWCQLEHGTEGAAQTLSTCAAGADAIVHCAALSSPWGSADAFHRANVASTAEVLQACRAANVARLVHISTPSLYFDYRDHLAVREDHALPAAVNEYARSKGQAEQLVRQQSQIETVILRPRALFGPWDGTLMPRLARVMKKGFVPLMRGGHALLDLTYIDNAIEAVWLALTRPLPQRLATYNVSNGEPIELGTLLGRVAQEFQLPLRTKHLPWPLVSTAARGLEVWGRWRDAEPAITRYSAGVLAFSQTLDLSAIRRDLGYSPLVPLDEGLRRHAQWWRAQQHKNSA